MLCGLSFGLITQRSQVQILTPLPSKGVRRNPDAFLLLAPGGIQVHYA